MKAIYTHDEAARIIDKFEDVLSRYDIRVPSPDDDEREPDNDVGLYGSTYAELLDDIEEILVEILNRKGAGCDVVTYVFSGDF